VLRTSLPEDRLDAAGTVRAYKSLAQVERAFRSLKTVDLKIRPVFHWTEARVRAHVFLCMLAYYLEWHMRRDLAPILFHDHDRTAAEAQRLSPVAPAKPSPAARRKAATKLTETREPATSFRSLLRHLACLTRNTVRLSRDHTISVVCPGMSRGRGFDCSLLPPGRLRGEIGRYQPTLILSHARKREPRDFSRFAWAPAPA
jgi:hypothetical protein